MTYIWIHYPITNYSLVLQLYETLALEEHKLNLYGGYELAKQQSVVQQQTNLGYEEDDVEASQSQLHGSPPSPPQSKFTPSIKAKYGLD